MYVEREEHCERCKGGVPGVASRGVTDQKPHGLTDRALLLRVTGCYVCCCDPATKLLRLLVAGNPKSNKPCAKIAAGKKCAGPCAFLL